MDELIQAIRDAPDDDAPRLVWADREGGDRGELVVLQCAIAARRGSRAERVRMQARVRELLPRFVRRGELWRRGFCEQLECDASRLRPALFAPHPLAREVTISGFDPVLATPTDEAFVASLAALLARVPEGRLRGLDIDAVIFDERTGMRGMGDVVLAYLARAYPSLDDVIIRGGDLTAACLPAVRALGLRGLYGHWAELAIAPVERLGPWGLPPAEVLPHVHDVVELDLHKTMLEEDELFAIARTPFRRLESLLLGDAPWSRASAAALLRLPLVQLTVNDLPDGVVELLLRSRLERLTVLDISEPDLATLRAHIPLVNDD